MAYDPTKRLKQRGYSDPDERRAFRRGYEDGYYRRERVPDRDFPNAYSAEYWEGFDDA